MLSVELSSSSVTVTVMARLIKKRRRQAWMVCDFEASAIRRRPQNKKEGAGPAEPGQRRNHAVVKKRAPGPESAPGLAVVVGNSPESVNRDLACSAIDADCRFRCHVIKAAVPCYATALLAWPALAHSS